MPSALDPAAEDTLIPLSALQHHLFCPRQNALIHVEGLWAEDAATAEGRLLHERVDAPGGETRPGVRVARGLALRSLALGVAGRADAVEFLGRPPRPFPVEYSAAGRKPIGPTRCSSAPRGSAWRRCSRHQCPRARCSTARRVGVRRSPSTQAYGR